MRDAKRRNATQEKRLGKETEERANRDCSYSAYPPSYSSGTMGCCLFSRVSFGVLRRGAPRRLACRANPTLSAFVTAWQTCFRPYCRTAAQLISPHAGYIYVRARARPVLCLSRVLPRKPEPVYHILADGVITLSTVVGISLAAAPGVNKFTARLAAARVKQQSATLFFTPRGVCRYGGNPTGQ